MEQIKVELEVKLSRITQNAKVIMWLSIISFINPLLYPIALILFLIYNNKLSKIKHIQSLGGIINGLKRKTTKELKSLKGHGEPIEQGVASLLLAHKAMVTILIIMGIIITIILGVIGISYM